MKHVKKLLSAVLVLVLALTMVLPVVAEETTETTYSIKIKNDKADHTYEAYQIFAGDLSTDEHGAFILSNIQWGNGVDHTDLGEAKDYAATITSENAAEIAKTLGGKLTANIAGTTNEQTNIQFGGETVQGYAITGLKPGYYLVKDKDGSLDANGNDAYTAYILQVVKDVEAEPKSETPSVDKQVKDNVDGVKNEDGTEKEEWREEADHAINETFQFKLEAKLPVDSNFANYETYEVVFKDSMSNGVTFESIESVKVNGNSVPVDKYVCTAKSGQKGGDWTLTISDIITATTPSTNITQGVTVEVIYNAHLNEDAVKNKTSVAGGNAGNTNNNKVELEYSNNPNGTGHGKTPEDYVWVFTYEVDNTKVIGGTEEKNEAGEVTKPATPLAGAEFRLYEADGVTEIELFYDETNAVYRPIKEGETAVVMSSATNGKFNIVGLDAGTYILKETKTPDGYNTCADVTITINAEHAENGSNVNMTLKEGSTMENQIENNKGTTLPGTGGIGTTIFYVVGGILVVGAAVLLIAKKRTKM